ncbi:unnamed protein product [Pieris macdunnoughi]|uniref:Uncharacterized protein n=1 Tax=Pieris macdunnoughi TaxID=345717 RepID=A0A821Y2Y7_9NEOP|nr:unnamed protein product [Pieris macdunnoughi]
MIYVARTAIKIPTAFIISRSLLDEAFFLQRHSVGVDSKIRAPKDLAKTLAPVKKKAAVIALLKVDAARRWTELSTKPALGLLSSLKLSSLYHFLSSSL